MASNMSKDSRLYSTKRIVLPVAAQADALFQVVHTEKVVFPLRIEHTQHDHALVIAHGIGTNEIFFGIVASFEFVENRVARVPAG